MNGMTAIWRPNQVQYNLYRWFLLLFKQYLQVYQNGWLMGLETGFLIPSEAYMHFYERTAGGVYATMTPDPAGVIHSNVLPGFQFRLRDLQRKPSLEALALDEVYQVYVLLEYQAVLAQAEAERMRATALAVELAQAQAELVRLRQQQS